MFSRILRVSKNLFQNDDSDSQPQITTVSATAAAQVRGDNLADASSMVTTRTQSQSLHDEDGRQEVASNELENEARKRKLDESAGSSETGKRRRVEVEEIEVEVADEAIDQGDVGSVTGTQNGVPRSQTKEENHDAVTIPRLDDDSDIVSNKRQHIHFGDDEPEEMPVNGNTLSDRDQGQIPLPNEDSDDEEAPETIENLSEFKKAQVESLKAAHAHDSVKTQIKEKRRKQDSKLKDQAGAKKKRNKPILAEEDHHSDDDWKEDPQNSFRTDSKLEDSLPALLPESILNSVPRKRRLDVEPDAPKVPERTRKLLKLSSKPAKDILVGKTTIRVSKPDRNSLPSSLPPKTSSNGSRNIRETWLKSLRGVEGGAKRRKTTTFIRK